MSLNRLIYPNLTHEDKIEKLEKEIKELKDKLSRKDEEKKYWLCINPVKLKIHMRKKFDQKEKFIIKI